MFGYKSTRNDQNSDYFLKVIRTELKVALKDYYVVIMIDELEYQLSNDKRDFNNIINLLDMIRPGFVKFGISNTMNLMTVVAGKTQKLHNEYLIFKPYKKDTLKGILLKRIEKIIEEYQINVKAFIPDAVIDYVVKNVVNNHSSDVRTLLAICAGIIGEKIQIVMKLLNQGKELTLEDVSITISNVIDFMLKNALKEQVEIIKRLGIHPQLLLLAICVSMEDTGHIIQYKNIEANYKRLLNLYEMDDIGNIMSQLDTLKNYNLIDLNMKTPESIRVVMTQQELDRCLLQIEEFEDYHEKVIISKFQRK